MSAAIEIHDLVVSFPSRNKTVDALSGVSLTVEQGEVVGFIGPNGAGKTTTLHVLLGFVLPTSGEVRLLGEDVRHSIARRHLGYLPEHPDTYKFLTGRELLGMAGRFFGLDRRTRKKRGQELLQMVDMQDAADRRIGTYSRGMMQRIGLAQALINDPDLVILDEPTGGLDPLGRKKIRNIIADLRDRGKTVFFSSHELSEVELVCDQIALLVDGKIAARGPVAEFTNRDQTLEQYFLEVVQAGSEGGCRS